MPLDPSALGFSSPPVPVSWNDRDTMLYALSVGATTSDLEFTTENTAGVELITVPSMSVVYCQPSADVWKRLGEFDWSGLVHAEQRLEIHRPLPVAGTGTCTSVIIDMKDKGVAAIVTVRSELRDTDGASLATGEAVVFIRSAGGWGGARGDSARGEAPMGPPDHETTVETVPTQALLYRLNADRNPLHSDPSFARAAGQERPILHGLCTLGIAILSISRQYKEHPGDITGFSVRFAKPCFPGDRLTTRTWTNSPGSIAFSTTGPTGEIILSSGHVQIAPTTKTTKGSV